MLRMHWTHNDNGRVAATWIKDTDREYRPLSLLLTEGEPPPVLSLTQAPGGLIASMKTWLCMAFHLPV